MQFGVGSQRRSVQKAVETVVSRGSARGAGSQPGERSTRRRILQVPQPHMIDSHFGLRNLRVIRSDSPTASYFAWSKFGSVWLPSWRAAARRGQRPNAERMVSGVLWVRVDLGLRLEDEPHLTRLLDDVGFRDVTGSGARVRPLGRTVLFDGENAARLQHREKGAQIGMGRVPLAHPVVEGPRHQNEVNRYSRNGVRMLWAEVIRLDLAEDGLVRDALPKGGVRGIGTVRCGAGLGAITQGRNVCAPCCAGVGRENLKSTIP